MSNNRRRRFAPYTPDSTAARIADCVRIALIVIGLLFLGVMCAHKAYSAEPPTPSLPHRPMHEIDIQGHQDLLKGPGGHVWCEGHVPQSITRYPDGDIVIFCRPATTTGGQVLSHGAN